MNKFPLAEDIMSHTTHAHSSTTHLYQFIAVYKRDHDTDSCTTRTHTVVRNSYRVHGPANDCSMTSRIHENMVADPVTYVV
jgi:hypothetical protein